MKKDDFAVETYNFSHASLRTRGSSAIIYRHTNNQVVFAHPSENSQVEIQNPESGRDDPNVEHGEDGEDKSPHQGGRDGDERGEDLVEPRLGLAEHDEGQLPHPFESLGGLGLGDHVIEIELEKTMSSAPFFLSTYCWDLRWDHVFFFCSGTIV